MLELIPLAIKFAPWIANMIFGGAAEQAVNQVTSAAKKIFGTTDVAEIERQIAADNAKAEMFRASLEADRSKLEAALKDVQSARQLTSSLVQTGSIIGWGAPIVSIIATIGFFTVIGFYFFGKVPVADQQILAILVGAMTAGYTAVIQFWLGSSLGSKQKDFSVANSVPVTALPAGDAEVTPARSRPTLRRM